MRFLVFLFVASFFASGAVAETEVTVDCSRVHTGIPGLMYLIGHDGAMPEVGEVLDDVFPWAAQVTTERHPFANEPKATLLKKELFDQSKDTKVYAVRLQLKSENEGKPVGWKFVRVSPGSSDIVHLNEVEVYTICEEKTETYD